MKKTKSYIIVGLVILGFLAFETPVFGQSPRRIVQLSGIILTQDSVFMPGVPVYVPKAYRGTTTNANGFFSMPVLVGDSVVITYVGYKRQSFTVPFNASEFQTILVEMVRDTTYLKEVTIMSLPTEEIFKEAVLALNIPTNDTGIDSKNMNSELLAMMVRNTPMDGNANYRYYIDQWSNSAGNKFHPLYNPFLNPLNWVKFIKDLKKKKDTKSSKY